MNPVTEITPVAAQPAVETSPAKPPNAIQILEADLAQYFNQQQHLIANLHGVEGAIQATQNSLTRLKAEAAKAEALVAEGVNTVETAIETGIHLVESEAKEIL